MVGQNALTESSNTIPVLIQLDSSTGTGFYAFSNNSIYLVTAKHVLMDGNNELRSQKGTLISGTKRHAAKPKNVVTTDFYELLKKNHIKYSTEHDYIIVKLGDLVFQNSEVHARLFNPPQIFRFS
jgi:hypothetical protein